MNRTPNTETRHFLQQAKRQEQAGMLNQSRVEMHNAARWLAATETGLHLQWAPANQAWVVSWHAQPLRLLPNIVCVADFLLDVLPKEGAT